MSTILRPAHRDAASTTTTTDGPARHEVATTRDGNSPTRSAAVSFLLAATRLSLGWIFLWAFLDKAFGLGHETAQADAWIRGGSPTAGFLGHATAGPFADFYQSFAGAAWADWLFMIGLAGIGSALMLGVAMRVATGAGILLLVLMWTAVLPPANNVFMDDHLIYAMTLGLLALFGAHRVFGLGDVWEHLPLVKRFPILK
ncbi:MAG: hypothetical protein ACSLEW_07320 [Nocardioides sp.]